MRARNAFPDSEGTPGNRNFVQNYYDTTSSLPATTLFKDFGSVGSNSGSDMVLFSFADSGLPMSQGGEYSAVSPAARQPTVCFNWPVGTSIVVKPFWRCCRIPGSDI